MVKHNAIKAKLESKLIPLVNAKCIENAELQVKNIHRKNDGFIALASKPIEQNYNQWCLTTKDLQESLPKILGLKNVYISINGFWIPKRRLKDIRHLNAFWVDLDYYNVPKYKDKTTHEMIKILKKKGMFEDVGEPSFFINSGNGMYMFWLIDSCSKHMLPLWNTIQKVILDKFLQCGADFKSADASHILRLAGTINTKTNRHAEFIYTEDKKVRVYKIQDFADRLLPKLKYTKEELELLKQERKKNKNSKLTKKEKEESKIRSLYNVHTLNFARLQDLETLVELRKGTIMEGCREMILFLHRYWSCCYNQDKELALQQIIDLNNQFRDPLSENEVIKATKRGEVAAEIWQEKFTKYMTLDKRPTPYHFFKDTGCYIYSNKKLIDELKITPEEMEHLNTIISTKEKNRRSKEYRNEWKKERQKKKHRNENGLTSREQTKKDNLQAIAQLLKQEYTQKDIAIQLGLAKSTISGYVKELKEENKEKSVQNNTTATAIEIEIGRVNTSDLEIIFNAI